jgi:hypothetical protein
MGLIFTPPLSIEDAKQRGYDVFEVLFANWGVTDAPPSTIFTDMQFPQPGQPGIPVSLAGIAIGPRSTVDRCWVSYDPLKKRDQMAANQPNGLLRVCSLDSPLMFVQAAGAAGLKNNPGATDDPAKTLSDKGQLYIFPMANKPPGAITFQFTTQQDTTVLPPNYTDVNGVLRGFASKLNPLAPKPPLETPFLHLYLYLKVPPIALLTTKRAPLQIQGQVVIPINSSGVEKVLAHIPTFGRKAVKIMMKASFGADFRVGALRGISQLAGMQEQPVDVATGVPANTPTVLAPCNECCHYADYTNLYCTPTTDDLTIVDFQLTAYD